VKRQSPTNGSMPCIGPTTAKPAPTNSGGELSPSQRAILASIRNDGPGTEAEVFCTLSPKRKTNLSDLRDDLAELETRALVKCATQPNGRRIWGVP